MRNIKNIKEFKVEMNWYFKYDDIKSGRTKIKFIDGLEPIFPIINIFIESIFDNMEQYGKLKRKKWKGVKK